MLTWVVRISHHAFLLNGTTSARHCKVNAEKNQKSSSHPPCTVTLAVTSLSSPSPCPTYIMASKEGSSRGPARGPRASTSGYASTVATQTDVAKYRGKYKELKSKVREIEMENDQIHLKTLNVKRTIQRMRLERALLYERLEAVGGLQDGGLTDTGYAEEQGQAADTAQATVTSELQDSAKGEQMEVDAAEYSPSAAPTPAARSTQGMKVTLRRSAPTNG